MIFFFVVIGGLSILSAYHLNRLSDKTEAILKENHFSVIYARNMAEELTILNQELVHSFLKGGIPDSTSILKASASFAKSLQLEKNNLTEAGEDQLVANIETGFQSYQIKLMAFGKNAESSEAMKVLQSQFTTIYQQTMRLSQMNEQAILLKADDAKNSAKKGLTHVSLLGTICFIITLSFTFNFASYFNERFSKLYVGMKEIGAGNFNQRLQFEGEDEFYDISLVFNDMAINLGRNMVNSPPSPVMDAEGELNLNRIAELKRIFEQVEGIKERASDIISKLEQKE